MSRLTADVRETRTLPGRMVDAMFRLYDRYYDATSETRFRADLRDKDHAILLFDRGGRLRGFSTLGVDEVEFEGRAIRSIFSGDTIIEHAYWGEQALAFEWTRLAGRIKAAEPGTPLYWFLIVKGYRTYRYLPVFARRFYPTWSEETPPAWQRLLDHLAHRRFGRGYDRVRGVISFPESRGHLKPDWADVPAEDMDRPEVRFFLERNPGHARGEELACITELAAENLRPLARRVFSRGMAA